MSPPPRSSPTFRHRSPHSHKRPLLLPTNSTKQRHKLLVWKDRIVSKEEVQKRRWETLRERRISMSIELKNWRVTIMPWDRSSVQWRKD